MSEKKKELNEMIEAVLLAIPREISAQEFYLNIAKRTTSDASKKMFLFLADQEKMHEAKLRNLLAELQTELKSVDGRK